MSARVDLYFGSAAAWRRFLLGVVTLRFPDGFTSAATQGQWRLGKRIWREPAHVLTIFYREDATSDARIEAIRTIYKARFRQASVLRADSHACVGV